LESWYYQKEPKMKKLFILLSICAAMFGCNKNQTHQEKNVALADATREQHRPLFHFTPPAKWMNDPNGMVYHNGEYHLFYQHYPEGLTWGPMHWGHAVSKDMVTWEHLPIALYPDSLGMIFSGSAVVDHNNTSGLGTAESPAMVAIFTYHNAEQEKKGSVEYQTQGIAYSLDNGRSWTKYENNPVLKNPGIKDFRDPKVMWHEEGKKWIMSLAVADHIRFYSSPNLKDWQLESRFGTDLGAHGGVWECPDLFKLPIKGTSEEKWVLLVSINPGGLYGGSGTQYFVGNFDGKIFVPDSQFMASQANTVIKSGTVEADAGIWIDYGRDNYAGVTWNNIPEKDGRRLFLGWMSNWSYANVVPTKTWRSAMTIPRALSLENTPAGLRLVSTPVKELDKLIASTHSLQAQTVADTLSISKDLPFTSSTFKIDLELETLNPESGFAIEFSNSKNQKMLIGYDAERKQYFTDRTKAGSNDFSKEFAGVHFAPRLVSGAVYPLQLWVDVASVELFADDGKTVMTDIFFPDEEFTNIRLIAPKGEVQIQSGAVSRLKPASGEAL
jgi:fructan beta-fructosidase